MAANSVSKAHKRNEKAHSATFFFKSSSGLAYFTKDVEKSLRGISCHLLVSGCRVVRCPLMARDLVEAQQYSRLIHDRALRRVSYAWTSEKVLLSLAPPVWPNAERDVHAD